MKPGDEARITGRPAHEAWMRALVGKEGTVDEVREIAGGEGLAVKVDGLPGGPFWLGAGYLETVTEDPVPSAPARLSVQTEEGAGDDR